MYVGNRKVVRGDKLGVIIMGGGKNKFNVRAIGNGKETLTGAESSKRERRLGYLTTGKRHEAGISSQGGKEGRQN